VACRTCTTLGDRGPGVDVAVVAVAVAVGVLEGVAVGVSVGVFVGVCVASTVVVAVAVAVFVGVDVGEAVAGVVAEAVAVGVWVAARVFVEVGVTVLVAVAVPVPVPVEVAVAVAVFVGSGGRIEELLCFSTMGRNTCCAANWACAIVRYRTDKPIPLKSVALPSKKSRRLIWGFFFGFIMTLLSVSRTKFVCVVGLRCENRVGFRDFSECRKVVENNDMSESGIRAGFAV
jgi:hypothetical protein